MVVQAAIVLKVEQDKKLARRHAAKVATAALAHREQVLATTRKQNVKVIAELAHTRQLVLQGQHAAETKAERATTLAKAAEKDARRRRQQEGLHKQRHLHILHEHKILAAPTKTGGLRGSVGAPPDMP